MRSRFGGDRTVDLQECRKELDQIDQQIVALFEQRMKVCGAVAEYKISVGKEVYDADREQQKLETVGALAHGNYNQTAVQELFSQMMTISRRYQYEMLAENGQSEELGFEMVDSLEKQGVRVVYQGVEGAYGHQAALKFFGEDADTYHVPMFEDAMVEVEEGKADYAVLPIENSSAGAVNDNYDLLIKYHNLIVGEVFLPVTHALLAGADAEISDIRTVYSHPQALAQCSQYLNEQGWHQVSFANTAVAAKKVVEDGDRTQAAVASEIAGKLYGLKVLKPAIQNNKNNTTRFLVLSRRQIFCKNASKISISFELPHRYGTLYNVLGNFVYNHVNMFMIESRPIQGRNWEYRFFIDIEGNLEDIAIKNALKSIEQESRNLRILGNY
ncbi:MAG: prephenate dehydratase [Clostridiales bacterium]|nr:prephenate dehydratase [Clostridiales bacterium]